MIRLIHKETIKDKTKYDYETDNFSTRCRHDIMLTGTGKQQNGYRKRQSGEQKTRIENRLWKKCLPVAQQKQAGLPMRERQKL